MLAPISWLKDYVDINVSPETLAQKLVAIGFEVEQIIYQSKRVDGVKVGRIEHVEKHPNADRLRVTKINIGDRVLQVVTNVPVEGGETIAVAVDGARLADGHEIRRGELRGVLSEGMLCGLEEVGLTANDADGQKAGDILRFTPSTPLGTDALEALGYDDVILDVAVTANRPDCNSIYKLAKEVAVALGVRAREPHIAPEVEALSASKKGVVKVDVRNFELCPRYMAAGVKNVRICPSDELVKRRLRAVGIRPINSIVDITNYVLTEIGQPMHAFDRRDIQGDEIVVRNARDGEHIVTLDGKEHVLKEDMLVICDEARPLALAGIMGGLNSGVKQDTDAIIFEAAKFARDNVRRTSRALNQRSDSSARFEKGIDFASQELGLKRALTLVLEGGYGEMLGGVIDVHTEYQKERELPFEIRKLEDILGCEVPKNALVGILERLGIKVEEADGCLIAHVGEDREDIASVNDIAEEFIRVYGYEHIRPTLFEYASLTEGGVPKEIKAVDRIKDALVACGLREAVTYSFTSPAFADKLALSEDDERRNAVRLLNPIGEALSVMRTNLTHSMLETLSYNATHFVSHAELFEVARVYLPKSLPLTELPVEKEKIAIGMYGEYDFFKLKGVVENLLDAMNVADAEFVRSKEPFLHPGRGADLYIGGKKAGYLGEVHPDVAKAYGVDNFRVYVAELFADALTDPETRKTASFAPFTRFPVVERDLAVVVDEDVLANDILKAAAKADAENLSGYRVFDTYRSEQIGKGKKSVALRFYFANLDRTLTDGEVNAAMDKILASLESGVGAKIR